MARAMWFYESMPPSRFVIQEHLRQSYWRAGLATVWVEARNDKAPYTAEGMWHDTKFLLTWTTATTLTLQLSKDAPDLVEATSLLLGFKPLARYTTNDQLTYEWHARGGPARWQALQSDTTLTDLVAGTKIR